MEMWDKKCFVFELRVWDLIGLMGNSGFLGRIGGLFGEKVSKMVGECVNKWEMNEFVV